ncbi:MAG: DUF2785 domain-containing protein [Lysinibacillus sp.]
MSIKQTVQSFSTMTHQEQQAFLLENGNSFLNQMLHHIGSADAELRDQLIYRTFVKLISDDLLAKEQMQFLFDEATNDKYLYNALGERNTDTVFTRSFSALLIANLLAKDIEAPSLDSAKLDNFFKKCGRYLLLEEDTRGFVDQKGWAHSFAHGADLAATSIRHPAFDVSKASAILHALKMSFWKGTVFVDDEEERFTAIIEALLARNVPEEVLIEWCNQLFDKFEMHLLTQGYNDQFFKGRTCTMNFAKTLYFSIKMNNLAPQLQNALYEQIAKWLKLGA